VDVWYGYPVGYVEVPEEIWRGWVADGSIQRADVNTWWTL
jgi:hypothetical protein